MRKRFGCRGYSQLELLTACGILIVLLAVLSQAFNNALGGARAGEGDTRAVVIAQSQLAALGVDHPLQVGVQSGSAGDAFHWRVTVRPYRDDQLPAAERVLQPLTAMVEVFWEADGQPRSIALTSLLLRPGPP
jgi:general secretion pathway protein I